MQLAAYKDAINLWVIQLCPQDLLSLAQRISDKSSLAQCISDLQLGSV